MRRIVQGLNVEIQETLVAAQINTFTEVLEKAQRIEIVRVQVKAFMQGKEVCLVEGRDKDNVIGVCHPLKWVEELVVTEYRRYLGRYSERSPKGKRTDEGCLTRRSDVSPSIVLWVL